VASCDLPRDPNQALERARNATLVAGVTEAPPDLVRRGGVAVGPEAQLIEEFARTIGAAVEWRWGSSEEHLRAAERFELDVVAGGLRHDSPWLGRVGFTRPWSSGPDGDRVLAVPPGENALLVALDRSIEDGRVRSR
jgi:hypothetical protein